MTDRQPRTISNFYCERCDGRGYLVADAEWEPYAVQCPACKNRRTDGEKGEKNDR